MERLLRPFQAAASAILPEEISFIDQRIGALHAKLDSLYRLSQSLETRDSLSEQIDRLQKEARRLERLLTEKERNVEFERASDRITEGFNHYLRCIKEADESTWTKSDSVSVRISERQTRYFIGLRPARPQLGGTLTIYFNFAYHFALLNLTRYTDCHFPGIAVLDVWPDIAKGASIRDRLALVLEPFVRLANHLASPIQVISTCRAISPLPDAHLIRLTETWR